MQRTYAVGFLAVVVIAACAVVVAFRTDPESIRGAVDPNALPVLAEEVPGAAAADGWIGSEQLTAAELVGEVVVYDFWTYSCVNCLRTFPYLRAWHDRYAADGLVIVGVHSPEFDFEREAANVDDAVEELEVTWPVALDPDHAVWDAFGNSYWPAKYVVDREGRLRYHHIGEGAYTETEDVLRALLGVDPDSPRAADPGDGAGEPVIDLERTPELYLGSLRAEGDRITLDGPWRQEPEYVEAEATGAVIELRYRAAEVNLVLSPGRVAVSLDGGEPRELEADDPELVRLVTDGPAGEHTLRIEALTPGIRAYAFTFGS